MKRFLKSTSELLAVFLVLLTIAAFGISYLPEKSLAVGPTNLTLQLQPSGNLYGAVITAQAPVNQATDFVTLYGTTGSTVKIKKINVYGLATVAESNDVSIVKKTAVDLGGTIITSGGSLAITPLNGTYDTFTISSQNMTSVVNSAGGIETGTLSIAGLTVGNQYIFSMVYTTTSGSIPTIIPTSGIATYSVISPFVTTVKNNILFTASATTAVFTLQNVGASHWASTYTTCYKVLAQPAAFNSKSPASIAWPAAYSVNPTTVGTGSIIRSATLNAGVVGSAGFVSFDFSGNQDQPIILNGSTEGIAINLNGQTIGAGASFSVEIIWSESTP
jgi:hypothetical protein